MQSILERCEPLLPTALEALLPARLVAQIYDKCPTGTRIEEVRLRRGRPASLTLPNGNLLLSCILTGKEMDALLPCFCQGALYAHEQALVNGYLPFEGGVRIGVIGRASVREGKIVGVSAPEGYAIRLPARPGANARELCALLRSLGGGGVLLFAPPGVGKTTLLRAAAAEMAGGDTPSRVAVVDTRGEFAALAKESGLLLDLLRGYPRGRGISIAARTLNAQLIVCDEIGDLDEANEILHAHAAGVPLLASAHATDVEGLLGRPGLRALHNAGCFAAYVGISRAESAFCYRLQITRREALHA